MFMQKLQAKKLFSLLCAGIMLFTAAGCSGSESPSSQNEQISSAAESDVPEVPEYLNVESDLPVIKDGYSKMLKIGTFQGPGYGDAEDIYFWEFVRQKMNIDAEIEQIQNRDEYLQLNFAANTLPDVLIGLKIDTNMQVKYGQMEKQLLPINDYLNESYLPNLVKIYEENPEWKALVTVPDGQVYSFGCMKEEAEIVAYMPNLSVNQTWMKEENLEDPKTLGEFLNMLRTFKARGDDIVPWAVINNDTNGGADAFILNALGYVTGYTGDNIFSPALRNEKVVIPAGDPEGYKAYAETMYTMYTEGLIPQDYYTMDDIARKALVAEEKSGVNKSGVYTILPEKENYTQWYQISPVTSDLNDTPLTVMPPQITTGGMVVTSQCKNPEIAMRFANYLFSEAGGYLCWQGAIRGSEDVIEGWGGMYVDENYQNHQIDLDNNPGKWTSTYDYVIKRVAGFPAGTVGYRVNETPYKCKANGLPVVTLQETYTPDNGDFWARIGLWDKVVDYAVEGYPSVTFFTEEEATRMTDLSSVLKAHVDEETAKFVTGARPLSEIDDYFAELNTLGFEEYLGYYQKAYDNYQSALSK